MEKSLDNDLRKSNGPMIKRASEEENNNTEYVQRKTFEGHHYEFFIEVGISPRFYNLLQDLSFASYKLCH